MHQRLTREGIKKVFAENVRVERARRNWSQEQFAELAEFPRSYVSKLERGQVNATLDLINRIANAFEMPPYKLLVPSK